MNRIFFILCLSGCLFSCKTRYSESVNKYTTPPGIGILTTDLPRYSKPPVPPHTTEATETSPNPDDVSVVEDSIVISAPEESIYTVDVSTFSWEIGIRQTQIIDVRTLTEYKEGHIYDAINMSVDDPSFVHQIQTLDKNSPVAVYCRSGIRSIHAAKILKDNGFRIIYNLNGGLNQWIKNGKEIIK